MFLEKRSAPTTGIGMRHSTAPGLTVRFPNTIWRAESGKGMVENDAGGGTCMVCVMRAGHESHAQAQSLCL